jgi:hypothetical protein
MEMRRASRYTAGLEEGPASSPTTDQVALPMASRSHHDSTRPAPAGERALLLLYWLVAGYGIRASRSLAALAVTLLLAAVLLDAAGFVQDRSYGRSLLFALESSVSLLKAPELRLTATGEVATVALRLLGPLFFGLTLLSLRGRVKR